MKPMKLGMLEETIGYSFSDKNLLLMALTHSSYANEHKKKEKTE
jgi:ribonuclease-3